MVMVNLSQSGVESAVKCIFDERVKKFPSIALISDFFRSVKFVEHHFLSCHPYLGTFYGKYIPLHIATYYLNKINV